jgi:GNAT superfamily N-acetyltransferase
MEERFLIRAAARGDVAELLRLIHALAVYEKLEHLAVGTPEALERHLFGPRPACEALVAEAGGRAVGFALYFTTFSTFLCKPGIYLEDVFVEPQHRGAGIGKACSRASRSSWSSAAAGASSGACSTGTSPRSGSTSRWARPSCANGCSRALRAGAGTTGGDSLKSAAAARDAAIAG